MSTLKNGVLLRNRKAENQSLMKVICSLLLLAPCSSALMISCCKYFLITVKLSRKWGCHKWWQPLSIGQKSKNIDFG